MNIVDLLSTKQAWSTFVLYLFTENQTLLNDNPSLFLTNLNANNSSNDLKNSIININSNNNNNNNNNNSNSDITNSSDKLTDASNETKKPIAPENECKICFDGEINTVIVNCGHQVFCEECAKLNLDTCPICRSPITGKGIIKVFKC